MAKIMTVLGPIEPAELGFTLPHEHVLVDFGGAQTAGSDRYDCDDVIEKMTPLLTEVYKLGARGFVDCSPMYLARDVEILCTLARKTGLNIITNTGQYKEPFLPRRTFEISAEELAGAVVEALQAWVQPSKGAAATGLGIAVPGLVDRNEGRVLCAPNLKGLDDFAVGAALQEATGLPVALDNDANAAGLA